MIGIKLNRRTFLQISGTAALGSAFIFPYKTVLADETDRNHKVFKLSKPRWIIYDNGSYDLISEEIVLKNCRPSIDGQSVMPKNVFLGDSPKGKRIVYELPGGFLMLDLKSNNDSISIGAELSGFSTAPRWFFPIAQAEVFGVNKIFKQGFGTAGKSGVYPVQRMEGKLGKIIKNNTWSYDSYLSFAFLGENEIIAIGNADNTQFLHRSTIYSRSHQKGLENELIVDEQVFFESGMLLEDLRIDNEYIKLPELYFYAGNKPYETMQTLAWKISEASEARQNTVTSYHWINKPGEHFSFDKLESQMDFLQAVEPVIPLHSIIINKGYCTMGDWLDPNDNWPGGLDRAAREIFKYGYRAGIWIAPFLVDKESKLFKQHPGWLIKNFDDEPIPFKIEGEGIYYVFDGSHPGFQNYLQKVFRSFRKSGYIFYDTAYMSWGLIDSDQIKRVRSDKTSVQIFRDILNLIREEIGLGSMWMMDNVPYGPAIGFADIVRISNSLKNDWKSGNVGNMIRESFFTHYFNNIFWQNCPEEIDLTNRGNQFSENEILSLALWQGILGGTVGTTEDLNKMESKTLQLLRFLEPNRRQRNAYLPFWPDIEEIKVAIRVYNKTRGWGVLFFNDKDTPVTKSFSISDLINKDSIYVYNWYPEIPIGFGKLSEINIDLNPHQSKLFYFAERDEAPPENLTLGGELSDIS